MGQATPWHRTDLVTGAAGNLGGRIVGKLLPGFEFERYRSFLQRPREG